MTNIHVIKSYIDQGKVYPNLNPEEREACYNGMGADWMGEEIRRKLDETFPIFEDSVRIHDADYEYGLTILDKIEADERLRDNCLRAAWHETPPWRHPWKYFQMRAVANTMYLAVRYGGYAAFKK